MSGAETIAAAGVVVALATFALLGVLAIATRPRSPDPGPSSMELGAEAPGIVNLLTEHFEPTPAAVPATLLDLGARRCLDIEDYGGSVIIRLRAGHEDGLRPFERQVLDHVRSLAIDGVVPAAAMTTGPEAASKQWWKRFRKAVVADARDAGLCRPRWAGTSVVGVWLGAAVAFGCAWLAHNAAGESPDFRPVDALIIAAGGAGMALAAIAGAITSSDRQRETRAGLAVAGQWLGIRRFLAERGDFATKPAASVVLWDRYLAHAAAMNLAPVAVEQLPLGTEDDHRAWSRARGRWRRVRVAYPRLRPGYGQHPALAVAVGLATGTLALLVLRWTAPLFDDIPTDVGPWPRVVGGFVLALLACGALWSALKVLYGLNDLFATATIEGVLLRARMWETGDRLPAPLRIFQPEESQRRRRFYVAVDDGASARIAAWRVKPALFSAVQQGARVRATVTPRLRHVRALEHVTDRPSSADDTRSADDAQLLAAAQTMAASRDATPA